MEITAFLETLPEFLIANGGAAMAVSFLVIGVAVLAAQGISKLLGGEW